MENNRFRVYLIEVKIAAFLQFFSGSDTYPVSSY